MKIKQTQPALALKPTQFSVGLLEIECRVKEYEKMKAKKRMKLVRDTRVPVVISPWKELCISDHHHFVFACWQAGVKHVKVKVVKDLSRSNLTHQQFWRKMARDRHAYLYDQFGTGPRDPLYLPIDVRGMADDPYRSLTWIVRRLGGFKNSTQAFAEFKWADFFRRNRLLHSQGRKGFLRAIRKAIRLAQSTKAGRLPGYAPQRPKKHANPDKFLRESDYIPDV